MRHQCSQLLITTMKTKQLHKYQKEETNCNKQKEKKVFKVKILRNKTEKKEKDMWLNHVIKWPFSCVCGPLVKLIFMCFYGHHIYLYHVQSISTTALYNQQRAAEYISSVHSCSCWADVTIRYWTLITWQLNENNIRSEFIRIVKVRLRRG